MLQQIFGHGKHALRLITLLTVFTLIFTFARQALAANFFPACGNTAALIAAINSANANAESDTINLAAGCNYQLIAVDNSTNGANGLPAITSDITINGNGATILRPTSAPNFRILHIMLGGNLTLNDLNVSGGYVTSDYGGGIFNIGTLTLNNTAVFGNRAGYHGGGIYNEGTVTLTSSMVSNNTADFDGGAIYSFDHLTVTSSTIADNTAGIRGGGIWSQGGATLINSAISGNSATTDSGGLFNNFGTLNVTNSTISGNTAASGGGIHTTGTTTLNNSIVANSTSGGECIRASGTVNASYSLIADGLTCVNGTNTNNLTGDPALNSDLTLSAASPAINAGNNGLIPGGITTDRANNPRIQDGTVDMGAYESAPTIADVSIAPATGNAAEGANTAITISRTGGTSSALTVSLNITASGATTSDYTLSGGTISGQSGSVTATIPAGQASVNVTLAATDDIHAEADESVTLTLVDTAAYNLGATTASIITIPANDLVVINTGDSGEGSLRQAVTNANAFASDDTITFSSVSGTITLTTGRLYLANNGTLTIDGGSGVTVSGNNVSGVFNVAGATVTLNNLTISGGRVADFGGGIFNTGTLTINNSTVSGNSASSDGGGINNAGTLTINNSTVSGNSASFGGGILSSGTLTINNSTVSGNSASAFGGGIFNGGTLTIDNSTISGNSTSESGGGIRNEGTLTVNSSTVSGNSAATNSGGIRNEGTLTVINSTVSGNSAAINGGGINNVQGGTATVTNSTVSGNSATNGGGIRNSGINSAITLNNSIIANSTTGGDCVREDGTVTVNHSLIENDVSCGVSSGVNGNLTGPALLNGDMTLSASSPAVNAGDNALIPGGVTTDKAGNPRIQGGTVDMGAFESTFVAEVSIAPATGNAAEGASTAITLSRTGSTAGILAVSLNITTVGATTADYMLTGGTISGQSGSVTVTIPAGQASVDVTLAATDDSHAEADESVTLTLVDGAAYNLGATTANTTTIPANDLVVINTNDSGEGSLRQAVANANAFSSNDTITFSGVSGTITLTSGELPLENNGTLTIEGGSVTVSGNNVSRVFNVAGGATVTLNNLTVTGGNSNQGGGIYNAGTLAVNSSTLSGNSASSNGGGIYSTGTLTLTNSTVSGNSASSNGGGGIVNFGGTFTVTNSTISGNSASSNGGGGIWNDTNGTFTVTNSTISGNSAPSNSGGGIVNFGGTFTVTNSTISGNSASFNGGGIWNGGTLTLNNSTVSGNTASNGGIFNRRNTLTLNNSIVANSTGGGDCVLNTGTVNASYSLIEDGSCGVGTGPTYTNGNLSGDPMLDTLTGSPAYFPLQAGSPAINAGDNSLVPSGITTDQAGNARIQNGTVDMGSFESAFVAEVSISPATGNAAEGASTTLTVSRTGSTTSALTVSLNITTVGATTPDYTLSGGAISGQSGGVTVTIPTGAASVDVTLAATDDIHAEADESVTLTLVDGTAYNLGATTSTTVTIPRNDLVVNSSLPTGEGTLAQAVENANTFTSNDTITFTVSSATVNNQQVLAANGTLTIEGGSGVTVSVASGFTTRVFAITSAAANITLNNLTITGGNSSQGGGIFNQGGTLALNGSTVSSNTASGSGGGIYNVGGGTLTLTNSTVSGNTASSYGSGIYTYNGAVTLTNSTVSGNLSASSIFHESTGSLALTDSEVSDNLDDGLVIFAGTTTLTNSVVSGNQGVGIFNQGTLTLNASEVSGNQGSGVGGIFNSGSATLNNSTVSGNTGSNGGGIFNRFNTAMLTLNNSTVSGNSAPFGGGILNGDNAAMTLNNSVVANSSVGGDCVLSGGTATASHSLIEDGSCGVGTGPTYTNGNLSGDPVLGALTGSPAYFPLQAGSPAINAGDNSLVPGSITTDQAGNARIQNGIVDMGSFESGLNPIQLSIDDVSLNEGNSGTTTFSFTLSLSQPAGPAGVTFDIATADGTATTADSDYVAQTLTGQTIASGQSSYSFDVAVIGDLRAEPDETFLVNISNVIGAVIGDGEGSGSILNDDTAGVRIDPTSGLTITEAGGTASFTVVLGSQPTADVNIALTSSDTGEGTVDPAALTFTAANWDAAQTVTVTGVDDAFADGDIVFTVSFAVSSSDPDYDGLAIPDLSVTNTDDDSGSIIVSPTQLSGEGNETLTYTIQFTSPPSGEVTVQAVFDPAYLELNGSTSPVTLTFTSAAPQTVSVRILNADANRSVTITHSITASTAPEYATGTALESVIVNIDYYPPPPPVPTCEAHNFDEGGVVRSSTADAFGYAVNCRVMYQNGHPTTWFGADLYNGGNIGIQGVLDLGVQQAIDIFSPPGMTYFEGGAVFCLRGSGTLIWMAAANQPRQAEIIGSYTVPDWPGFTCATLFEPGTLVLVNGS